MAFENATALLIPLAASFALHTGTVGFLQWVHGTPEHLGKTEGGWQAPLRVTLLAAAFPAPEAASGIALNETPGVASSSKSEQPRGIIELPLHFYFPPQELSQRPETTGEIQFEAQEQLPLEAGGRIVLRLLINEYGTVDKITVETNDAPKKLEDIAMGAFSNARFKPGMRNNRPVKSQMLIEVALEKEGAIQPEMPSSAMR